MARLESLEPGRGRRGRRFASRAARRSFLIVCEGEVTEVRYFEAFPVRKEVLVAVRGEGKNTTSLVAAAVEHADRAARHDAPFDEVWVVYDHDDFGADKFNRAAPDILALNDTRDERWHAAWSHQAFEVWYLLHFQYFDGRLHRDLVQKKLGEQLAQHHGRATYCKKDPQIYELLLSRQDAALKHAHRLMREHGVEPHGRTPPAEANPCTRVHLLVEALNAEIRCSRGSAAGRVSLPQKRGGRPRFREDDRPVIVHTIGASLSSRSLPRPRPHRSRPRPRRRRPASACDRASRAP